MKHNLRRRMRSVLRSIEPEVRRERSRAACRLLAEQPEWQNARTVFLYLATQHELDTTSLADVAWGEGRRVLAPRVDPRTAELLPIEIRNWADCLPGYRNVLEPVASEVVPIEEIDLVVLPGLAFDAAGVRLGTGGGYYDRYLQNSGAKPVTCGFAFEMQFVAVVPSEQHDQRVQMLVTDEAVRRYA